MNRSAQWYHGFADWLNIKAIKPLEYHFTYFANSIYIAVSNKSTVVCILTTIKFGPIFRVVQRTNYINQQVQLYKLTQQAL